MAAKKYGFSFNSARKRQPSLLSEEQSLGTTEVERPQYSFFSDDANPQKAINEAPLPNTADTTAAAATASGGKSFMENPGMMQGIAQASTMVAGASDPEGDDLGPALSGAASGAATGTTILPGYGTAIGAAIGLGLGLMQADNTRKKMKKAANLKSGEILGEGLSKAAAAGSKAGFRFGGGKR